jgi:hypothetical protein
LLSHERKERMDMAAPPEPQPVLNPLTRAAIFLVVAVGEGGERTARDLLGDLAALQRSVGFRAPEDTLACRRGDGTGALDEDERAELARLRRENAELAISVMC